MNNASKKTKTVPPARPNNNVPAITNVSETEMLTFTVGRLTGSKPLTTVSATRESHWRCQWTLSPTTSLTLMETAKAPRQAIVKTYVWRVVEKSLVELRSCVLDIGWRPDLIWIGSMTTQPNSAHPAATGRCPTEAAGLQP